jgi:hypothetical protein
MSEAVSYSRVYTRKVNGYAFLLLLVHLPVLCLVAAFVPGKSVWTTAAVMGLLLLGPGFILLRDASSQWGAVATAIAAMGVSALAIHVSGGMIEAHFELFVLIALLTVYGRVSPLLVAGATIALHHVVFWLWLPASVFNYKASLWIVLLHAFFVILEVVPACWIARQFGYSIEAQALVADRLGAVSEQIVIATQEVAAANHSLSQGACEQAATIEETSAAVEEVNAMARRNSANAGATAELVKSSQQGFTEANHWLDEAVTAMGQSEFFERADCEDHQGDRPDCVSDEYPGAECGGGGGARGRIGRGICGGGGRGAEPGAAERGGGAGFLVAD